MTETQLQAKCVEWYHNEFRFTPWKKMLHCNNNNSHNNISGNKAKALGVVPGVSDLELICPTGRVVFIELKIPGGVQSNDQIEFMNEVQSRGHSYLIIFSFEDFKNTIWAIIGR